ncbi:MAG: LLM class flavin-dependent oxidoreductase [Actinomycetota bacterium]|nr:LLM class flavin-dependent oxidoreductase [Actinomycetota bacterium]
MTALSVLDQSLIPSGSTAAEALRGTVALARESERLGYRRFWLAEHHNSGSVAGTAPEVLSSYVASRTSSIRVGSGGILMSHYSPLKVAEVFRTLEALFPGRIDLALGRTPGADPLASEALHDGPGAFVDEDYPGRVADVIDFLHDTLSPDHRFAGVRAMPDGPSAPEAWVLGSSSYGSALAARMGLPFSFAHFVSPRFGPQVMAAYRRRFRPSPLCPLPVASVGVSVVCADSDAEAERLAISDDLWHLRPEGAERGCLLPVEEAEAFPLTDLEHELMVQQQFRRVVGAPDRVRALLLNIADAYGVEELVVRTVSHDPDARLRSYRLLAAAFDLTLNREA